MSLPKTKSVTKFHLLMILLQGSIGLTGVAVARADEFELDSGTHITGTLLNPDEAPRKTYHIQLSSGAKVRLQAEQVVSAKVQTAAQRSYRGAIHKLPHTLEAHWAMAEKCRAAGMRPEREFHMRQVLEFDPNHAESRRALGYVNIDNKWIIPDEYMRRQGYVRHQGQWRLPQEVEIETRLEQWAQEERDWKRDTKRWRSWILKGKETQAGLDKFREIRSGRAAPALADLLDNPKEDKRLRLLYVDVLGRMMYSSAATAALLKAVMEDNDADVVDLALEKLKADDPAKYVPRLAAVLKTNDNRDINRAGMALGRLGDPSAIPALIDALETKHKKMVSTPSINSGFTPTGGGGFSTGGGPKVVEAPVRNRGVLTGLTELTPDGVNFEYDERAWRNWHVRWNTPPHYELRRTQ